MSPAPPPAGDASAVLAAGRVVRPAPRWDLFLAVGVGACVVVLGARALASGLPYDFGFYYRGAAAAWRSGRPFSVSGWVGTPFAAASLAPLTAVMPMRQAALLLTSVNLAIAGTAVVLLYRRLSPVIGDRRALVVAGGSTILFAPVISTIWWRQLNLVVVALGIAGLVQLRRGRGTRAAVLVGLSVALKPLLIFVPVALVLRRETRRVGVLAVGIMATLTIAGQAFLVARGAPVRALAPLDAYHDFASHVADPAGSHACHPGNVAASAFLCRSFGTTHWQALQAVGLLFGLGVTAAMLVAVRRCAATSFEYLAVVVAVSVLFGPIEWTHYQVVLAPLLVVVAVHLCRRSRPLPALALAVSYLGLSLVWSPSMTVPRLISAWSGATPIHASFVLMRATAIFQLLLFAVAVAVLRPDASRPPGEGSRRVPSRSAGRS